ncbi:MAG: hypothetical protein N2167_02820 [Flavobacteriales bacterium]|nr:hypothetical protein [Flavobacteriales bacterium]
MASFKQWLNTFLGLNTHVVNNEFVEPLVRREDEQYNYRRWKNTTRHKQISDFLLQHYFYVAHRIIESDYLYTWNSPSSNGFFIKPCVQIEDHELLFLFEWFREKIPTLSYYCYTAEKQYHEQHNQMFQTDFIYFKPIIDINDAGPWNQQFGNIELHLYYKSREPIALKLMANVYSDRNYTKHLPFEQLLEIILKDKAI